MFVTEYSEQTGAEREIRRRILSSGAIPFAEFMEVALYHSDGYYSNRGPIGAGGDFFTSPVAHPAFGALICTQLETMWCVLGCPEPFWVIEAGAGDGVLGADIVRYACSQFPRLSDALRYVAVDRVAIRDSSPNVEGIEWIASTGLPVSGIVGCVLSNELLDAMPVRRFEIRDSRPYEVYIDLDADGAFVERLVEPASARIADRVSPVDRPLPDGFRGEVSKGLSSWMVEVTACLQRGFVLTIDYGYEREMLYSDERRRGTLQTYYRHTEGGSPYQRVGRQDMTAHVDFTELVEEGRRVGLRPAFLTTQGEFLHSLGYARMEKALWDSGLATASLRSNVRAMRRLIDQEGLGRFKVLVQEKNSGIERASELVPSGEVTRGLGAPVTTSVHLPAGQGSIVAF